MPAVPGPTTSMKLPSVLLCWNVLWSTCASSPPTTSQYFTLLASWKVLRVNWMCVAPTGMDSPRDPVNRKPAMTTLDTLLPMLKPPLPVIVAPPTCWACTVTGAAAVPERLMPIVLLVEYEPSASWITSPGAALPRALCSAEMEVTTRVAASEGSATATEAAAIIAPAAPATSQYRVRADCAMGGSES
jgi:hypothetical protein